jgi:hypothetical protein
MRNPSDVFWSIFEGPSGCGMRVQYEGAEPGDEELARNALT